MLFTSAKKSKFHEKSQCDSFWKVGSHTESREHSKTKLWMGM